MTWGEFKQAMDVAGVKDEMEIWYIDVSFPDPSEPLNVSLKDFEAAGITVTA